MKKGDYVVLLLIIIISAFIFSNSFITLEKNIENAEKNVLVLVDGKLIKKYGLENKGKSKIYKINSKYGHNEIEIDSEGVRMICSDCKDKICLRMDKITRSGQSIICLPNRLVITIEAEDEMDVVLY